MRGAPLLMESLLRDVRLYIYRQVIATSCAPPAAETARALGCSADEVDDAYRALADRRMIVLRPGTTTIWMAMPFSNMQTPFTVISGGRAYYANCAWDAFGIAALLDSDARIFTTCADCGGALERKITSGALVETRGLVHFALPPRRWWDDVGFT
jgi:DNA-binding transcriptional MocR family regulator